MNTQGQGRFLLQRPVPQGERVFLFKIYGPPAPGKELTIMKNVTMISRRSFLKAAMAASAVSGTPRMGPIFGGMLMSGKKVAEEIIAKLKK